MRRLGFVLLFTFATCSAESACYRSATEAAAQHGARDAAGFRVGALRWDALSGTGWITIFSCAHPERPGILLRHAADFSASPIAPGAERKAPAAPLILAGAPVRLLLSTETTRIELSGYALANGAVGDTIRVRMPAQLAGAPERIVTGIVRPDAAVEMEAR